MQTFRSALSAAAIATMVAAPFTAQAAPIELDTLYDPYFGKPRSVIHEGYLEFINPTEHPNLIGTPVGTSPPGQIQTEEYTGWTQSDGIDRIDRTDADVFAGDRADFDWVQENRPCETGGGGVACNNPQPVNHPGQVGAMGWTIGQTEASPHASDPGPDGVYGTPDDVPHDDGNNGPTHSDEQNPQGPLPHLENDDYEYDWFNAVDVFSIISIDQDTDVDVTDPDSLRDAALDYELDFANSVTGASSDGVLSVIWIPGWTNQTYIDDYVARWVPRIAGKYDVVAIEPISSFPGDYEATEIDAIKGIMLPEPGMLSMLGLGLAALGFARRRRLG